MPALSTPALPGPASAAPADPRRTAPRLPCGLTTQCRTVPTRAEGTWRARVRNVSAVGVGLLLERRFEAGTVLAIDVPEGAGPSRLLLARVVQATPSAGAWLVGCQLAHPLSDDEIRALREAASAEAA